MKLSFLKPFYPIVILLLPAGCGQKAPAAEATERAGAVSNVTPSPGRLAPLRTAAGKKEGYTQREMDSIQNITSLRKKF